jgi:hypothetical protein
VARAGWLTFRQFADRVGEPFRATVGDGVDVTLELVEATESDEPGGSGPDGQERRQFSLLFRGPAAPVLAQGTYPIRHGEFEDLRLFLVPLGPRDGAMRYEAVFA